MKPFNKKTSTIKGYTFIGNGLTRNLHKDFKGLDFKTSQAYTIDGSKIEDSYYKAVHIKDTDLNRYYNRKEEELKAIRLKWRKWVSSHTQKQNN